MTRESHFRAAILGAITTIIFPGNLSAPVRAQSTDPCAATSRAADTAARGTAEPAPGTTPKTSPLDHDDRWSHLDSLWAHRAAVRQGRVSTQTANPRLTQDAGEIAVLQDAGDLVIAPNLLDLRDVGLRLMPNDSGGYDVSRVAFAFRQPLGTPITMDDDDARQIALPFTFSFFGRTREHVFVNSDGNLTFGDGDVAATAQSISRFLTGSPRVAPLFSDLDPSAGGRISTFGDDSVFTVTWCAVPEYGTRQSATVQVTLHRAGPIDIQVSSRTTIREAVVECLPEPPATSCPWTSAATSRFQEAHQRSANASPRRPISTRCWSHGDSSRRTRTRSTTSSSSPTRSCSTTRSHTRFRSPITFGVLTCRSSTTRRNMERGEAAKPVQHGCPVEVSRRSAAKVPW